MKVTVHFYCTADSLQILVLAHPSLLLVSHDFSGAAPIYQYVCQLLNMVDKNTSSNSPGKLVDALLLSVTINNNNKVGLFCYLLFLAIFFFIFLFFVVSYLNLDSTLPFHLLLPVRYPPKKLGVAEMGPGAA